MSVPMKPDDPAYWMLFDGVTSTPTVYSETCYICRDPEFAMMGLPLCYPCYVCGEHVPADDIICDNGHRQPTSPEEEAEYDVEEFIAEARRQGNYVDPHPD